MLAKILLYSDFVSPCEQVDGASCCPSEAKLELLLRVIDRSIGHDLLE